MDHLADVECGQLLDALVHPRHRVNLHLGRHQSLVLFEQSATVEISLADEIFFSFRLCCRERRRI